MTRSTLSRALFALLLAASAAPALATSTTSSAASDGISASVGSISTSIERSSRSSTGDDKVADGDYTVIELAEDATRPGQLRVALQRDDRAFFLVLPQQTAQRAGLAAGDIVSARQRDWGVEFSAGQPRRAFFLALVDAWLPELQTRPVAL